MVSIIHEEQIEGAIHVPYNWVYADATARAAATGFISADVGRLALQQSDNTLWILSATTPTWVAVSQGLTNPMTTQDDIVVGGVSGAAARLAKGTDGQYLAVDPTTHHLLWRTVVPGDVSGFDTQVRTNRLDQMAVPTADVSMNSHKITNVTNPASAQDAATKAYVDASGGGGTGLPAGWFNVTDPTYGAVGDGTTDDTTAIQDAIDDCETAGGGVVYFPAGIYRVNGALQDTGRSNAQLLLPRRDVVTDAQITIVFRGEVPPPQIPSVGGTIVTPPVAGSIIKGTLNSGAGGALLGAWGPSGSTLDFTMINVVIEQLTIRMPANPVLTALNLDHCAAAELRDVTVDTGQLITTSVTQPTTTTSYGIKLPMNNNGAWTPLRDVNVIGFYFGYLLGEHTNADGMGAWACKYAAQASAAYHASHIKRILVVHCTNGIAFIGGTHPIQIDQYDVEHADPTGSPWYASVYDIDDASNYAAGVVIWHAVLSGSGNQNSFVKNGGTGLLAARLIDYDDTLITALNLQAGDIAGGQFAMARLASGTPDGTKFIRDDGVLATPSGGGGGAGGALEYVGKITAAGGETSLTLPFPTGFGRTIVVKGMVRGVVTSASDDLVFNINADSGTNYDYSHSVVTDNTSINPNWSNGATFGYMGNIAAGNDSAGRFSPIIAEFLEYQAAKHKECFSRAHRNGRGSGDGHQILHHLATTWKNTAAITSIVVSTVNVAGFAAGSEFAVYVERDITTPAAGSTLVASQVRATDGALDISGLDFTGYDELLIRFRLRSDRAADNDTSGIRFNNDTSNSYDSSYIQLTGSSPNANVFTAESSGQANGVPGATSTAGYFAEGTIRIVNPAATVQKQYRGEGVMPVVSGSATRGWQFAGLWASTVAITQVAMIMRNGGSNWKTDSYLKLYGIKW